MEAWKKSMHPKIYLWATEMWSEEIYDQRKCESDKKDKYSEHTEQIIFE